MNKRKEYKNRLEQHYTYEDFGNAKYTGYNWYPSYGLTTEELKELKRLVLMKYFYIRNIFKFAVYIYNIYPNAKFFKGEKPWGVKADILMPCATQNEVDVKEAELMVANGVKYYVEVSNMPTTNEAVAYLKANGVIVAPSKAVNAGGVSVSGLEMSQNSMRYSWTAEEVDEKLKMIMKNIFDASIKAANDYGLGDDLVAGANIAGFIKVAEAMKAQGVC